MAYIGKSPTGTGVRQRYYFTATGGETSISGTDDNGLTLVFSDGKYVDVMLNGVTLVAGTDYNTSTANTIGGLAALSASDIVEVVVYDIFTVADTVSAKDGGTFASNVTVSGTVTANQLDTDNIRINGNTISSTDTNGNLNLDPNGTGLFLPNRTPCFFSELSADQTLTDATETVVQFNNEDFDVGDIWDTTNYRLTVDANTVGYYHISCYLYASGANSIEDMYVRLRKNGTVYVENYNASNVSSASASGTVASLWFSTVIPLTTSGDYADVTVYADRSSSGTTLVNQISTSRTRTYISGFRLGGA